MMSRISGWWRDFWRTPDPVFVDAGAAGEVVVARTRFGLTLLVLAIPILDHLRRPQAKEVWVGIWFAAVGAALAAGVLWFTRRRLYRPWVGFSTSLLDITLISIALIGFLFIGQPYTTVNSRVVFAIYFVSIAASALRFDARVCLVTGIAAALEYLAVVAYTASHWRLDAAGQGALTYGVLDWSDQVSRMLLLLIASVTSTAVVLRTRRLQWLSARDRLTGALNRAVFDDVVVDEVARAARYNRPLSILMVDVDRFKDFNDRQGHTAGDAALHTVSEAIRRVVRAREILARYGGDEFVVLLPETPADVAVNRGEAIRLSVENTRLELATGTFPLTVSVGAATYPEDGVEPWDVVACADARLYAAKQLGRNRVIGAATAGPILRP